MTFESKAVDHGCMARSKLGCYSELRVKIVARFTLDDRQVK